MDKTKTDDTQLFALPTFHQGQWGFQLTRITNFAISRMPSAEWRKLQPFKVGPDLLLPSFKLENPSSSK